MIEVKTITERITKMMADFFGRGLGREQRRKNEKEVNKTGRSKEQVEYDNSFKERKVKAEELYELISRTVLHMGFYLSPEIKRDDRGSQTVIVVRPMTWEEHQVYTKSMDIEVKKAPIVSKELVDASGAPLTDKPDIIT